MRAPERRGKGTAPRKARRRAGTCRDRISLTGLRVFARHGVHAAERKEGQEFVIDAVLWLDTRPAAAGDDLAATVDYGTLMRTGW